MKPLPPLLKVVGPPLPWGCHWQEGVVEEEWRSQEQQPPRLHACCMLHPHRHAASTPEPVTAARRRSRHHLRGQHQLPWAAQQQAHAPYQQPLVGDQDWSCGFWRMVQCHHRWARTREHRWNRRLRPSHARTTARLPALRPVEAAQVAPSGSGYHWPRLEKRLCLRQQTGPRTSYLVRDHLGTLHLEHRTGQKQRHPRLHRP